VALFCAAVLGGVLVWKGTRGRGAAPVETAVVVSAPQPPPPPPEDDAPQRTREEALAEARRADAQQRARDVEAAMSRVPITMYVGANCALCDAARAWMKQNGIRWSEADVADPGTREELKKLSPSPSVPTFDVGGEVVVGFSSTSLLTAIRRAADKRTP
jgi:glutaredoxin